MRRGTQHPCADGVEGANPHAGGLTPEEPRDARVPLGLHPHAMPRVDQHTLFAAEIMGRTYFALLEAMGRRQFRVFGRRVSVPTARKLSIALRCWVQSRWGHPMGSQPKSEQSKSDQAKSEQPKSGGTRP